MDSDETRDFLDGFGRKTRFSGRIRTKKAFFWTDSDEKLVFLDGFGRNTCFSGRCRTKNAFFWSVSDETHDFLDGFVRKGPEPEKYDLILDIIEIGWGHLGPTIHIILASL